MRDALPATEDGSRESFVKHGLHIVFWTWPAGCVIHQSGGKGYPNDDAATSDAHKVIVDLELAMTHTEHALWARYPRVKVRASRVPAGRSSFRVCRPQSSLAACSMVVLPRAAAGRQLRAPGRLRYPLGQLTKPCNLTHLELLKEQPLASYSTWTVQQKRTVNDHGSWTVRGAPEWPPGAPRAPSRGFRWRR